MSYIPVFFNTRRYYHQRALKSIADMSLRPIFFFLFSCHLFILTGCKENVCETIPDISDIKIDFQIERLEKKLVSFESEEEVRRFLSENELFAEKFLRISQYPDDSLLVNNLLRLASDPYIDTLYEETRSVFGDLSELSLQLEQAFQHIKYHYPDFYVPEVKTIITGMGDDLFVSDSLIVIGLDFFLGEGAKYRPLSYPNYILKRYQPQYIVPMIVLLIGNNYNHLDNNDLTMLSDIIFYGKTYFFTKQILPCTPDTLITGYTEKELAFANRHAGAIWAYFIEGSLFYETNHLEKRKYIEERPSTYEIDSNCPGRIGTWLGWKIVRQYMDRHPELSLRELMHTEQAQMIFSEANYKP